MSLNIKLILVASPKPVKVCREVYFIRNIIYCFWHEYH